MVVAATLGEYCKPFHDILEKLLVTLTYSSLMSYRDCCRLAEQLDETQHALKSAATVIPRGGLSVAVQVLDLVQCQLLDREECAAYSCSPGVFEWISSLHDILEKWESLPIAEQ